MARLEEIRPLLSSRVAQSLADFSGGLAYGGATEGSDLAAISFGGPAADFILYGIVNGVFTAGPLDPNDYIDPQNNPMPYWAGPTSVSGGAIQCQYVADSSSPSGFNLRFVLNPGASGDEAYVEQVVPIGGTRQRAIGHLVRSTWNTVSVTGSGANLITTLQYLTATGATTGNLTTNTAGAAGAGVTTNTTAYAHAQQNDRPPSDVAYLRIRLGVQRIGAAADASVLDLCSVRCDRGFVNLVLGEFSSNSYAAGVIRQRSGRLEFKPNGTDAATPPLAVAEGEVAIGTAFVLSSIITPTISANQNNWAPTGLSTCSVILATVSGATRTITGFDATGFTEGQRFTIRPSGGNDLVLAHASGSSSAGNQIASPGAANITVRNRGGVDVVYLPTESATAPFSVIAV